MTLTADNKGPSTRSSFHLCPLFGAPACQQFQSRAECLLVPTGSWLHWFAHLISPSRELRCGIFGCVFIVPDWLLSKGFVNKAHISCSELGGLLEKATLPTCRLAHLCVMRPKCHGTCAGHLCSAGPSARLCLWSGRLNPHARGTRSPGRRRAGRRVWYVLSPLRVPCQPDTVEVLTQGVQLHGEASQGTAGVDSRFLMSHAERSRPHTRPPGVPRVCPKGLCPKEHSTEGHAFPADFHTVNHRLTFFSNFTKL